MKPKLKPPITLVVRRTRPQTEQCLDVHTNIATLAQMMHDYYVTDWSIHEYDHNHGKTIRIYMPDGQIAYHHSFDGRYHRG